MEVGISVWDPTIAGTVRGATMEIEVGQVLILVTVPMSLCVDPGNMAIGRVEVQVVGATM